MLSGGSTCPMHSARPKNPLVHGWGARGGVWVLVEEMVRVYQGVCSCQVVPWLPTIQVQWCSVRVWGLNYPQLPPIHCPWLLKSSLHPEWNPGLYLTPPANYPLSSYHPLIPPPIIPWLHTTCTGCDNIGLTTLSYYSNTHFQLLIEFSFLLPLNCVAYLLLTANMH